MAVLSIRNLPPDVHKRLRVRAARAGHSMEAEARAILARAVSEEEPAMDPSHLQAWVADLYGGQTPTGAVDELIAERRQEAARE
jgi:plasmid stability protein